MRRLAPLFPLLAAFLTLGCHRAVTPPARQSDVQPAVVVAHAPYLRADEFDCKSLLSAPPPDGSPAHVAEIDRMLDLQARRTPDEAKRCQSEEEVTVFSFASVLGPWFTAEHLPQTAALMQEVYDEAKTVSSGAKVIWKRTRPMLYDPRIKPCVVLEKSSSYPSGHATRGVVWAVLLAEIFPDQRDALMARGREIGTDRTLAGMHYPSDVQAGQSLGAEIARRLLNNPRFLADLECVRVECLAASRERRRAA